MRIVLISHLPYRANTSEREAGCLSAFDQATGRTSLPIRYAPEDFVTCSKVNSRRRSRDLMLSTPNIGTFF
jgi:hypothetical protein